MIKSSARKFDIPYLNLELESIIKQMNSELAALKSKPRKYSVIPNGAIDGVNKIFILDESFHNEIVWLDTTRIFPSDYVVKEKKIVFNSAPATGVVRIDYDPL